MNTQISPIKMAVATLFWLIGLALFANNIFTWWSIPFETFAFLFASYGWIKLLGGEL